MAGAKLYDSVPNEIAMMVWKQAVHTSGVHHLRFFVMNRDDDGHLLGVKAWETTHKLKNAVSTWHHRYTISHIDKLSEDVYMKWVANLRAKNSLWIAPLKHKKVKEEHPVGTHTAERFKVDSFRDLVVVTFTESYINFDLLDEEANRDRFRGLRRIGLNYKQTQTGNSWGTCPFQCTCHRKSHKDWDHCPVRIVQFLHFFPDIEHVYLIIRVAATNLVLPKSVKLGGEAAKKAAADRRREAIGKQPNVDKSDKVIGSKVTKKPLKTSRKPVPKQILTAEEIIERHLAAVHQSAVKDNLEIWSDLERTYVELEDIRHLQRIKYHHNVRQVMQGIKKTWKRAAERPRAREAAEEGIGDVRFHYLICRDRISRKAPEATKE